MKYLIACLIIAFILTIVWVNKFGTIGSGSDVHSPDGRYRVSSGNYLNRSLTQGKNEHVTIEITEIASDKKIWSATRYLNDGETATDFRHNNLTQWTPDSKSVSITISNSEVLVIPLP